MFCVYYFIDPLLDCKQYSICRHPSLLFLKPEIAPGRKKKKVIPPLVQMFIIFFLSKRRGLIQSNQRSRTLISSQQIFWKSLYPIPMLDTPALYITLILSFMLTFAKDKIMTAAWIHRNICKHTTKKNLIL